MTATHLDTRLATHRDCVSLAMRLAPLALFRRYQQSAEALARRWSDALARGTDGKIYVASDPQVGAALGLCWFTSTGTFGGGAYLKLLAVDPQHSRRGVGQVLLQRYEADAGEASRCLFLLCSDFNTDAQAFYGHHGYCVAGRLPDYVCAGVTELIFYKRLQAGPG